MSLLAFASVKGAPGVTTAALVVGALWPRPVLVADCDPAGGDLAVRLPLADGTAVDPDRGLLSLAATARRGMDHTLIGQHTQTLLGGLDVLVGVRTTEQSQVVAPLWPALGSALDALPGVDVLADCGRLATDGSQLPLLRSARGVVLFVTPTVTAVMHLRERLATLTTALRPEAIDGVPVGVVVVAPPQDVRDVDGIRETLSRLPVPIPVLGHLAWDPKGAEVFSGNLRNRADRSLLVRTGRELTARLASSVAPFSTAAPTTPRSAPDSNDAAEPVPASLIDPTVTEQAGR